MTEAVQIEGHTSVATTDAAPLRPKTRPQPGDLRHGRSSITNGRRMHLDPTAGDAAWSRRFRDIFKLLVDGADDEGARQQARRCATIALACERMESATAAGEEIDISLYSTLSAAYGQAIQCLRDLKHNVEAS